MSVRIIAITSPCIPECSSPSDLVAYAARVSNPANQANKETAPRLLQYCARNKHWSVFEMCHAVLEIETTRDIAHQIIRHRSMAIQEFSQRYANASEYVVNREARLQDSKNRQNSIEVDDSQMQTEWEQWQETVARTSAMAYSWALKKGIAKECARVVLPEGLTKTKIYMAGSVRSWIHYCQVRCDKSVQKEHREIAQQCWRLIVKEFPDIGSLIDA